MRVWGAKMEPAMRDKSLLVTVCIVSWNTKDLLDSCLSSVYRLTQGFGFEVIVVDNGSSDGSPRMVSDKYPQCKLIQSGKNLGFAGANNLGAKIARGPYILFLNPDTELKSNSILDMADFLSENPSYGAVGCRLLNRDGSIQYVCARTYPTPFNQFCFLSMLDRVLPNSKFFSTVEMRYWDHRDSRDVDCLSGACIMTRKEIFEDLKGFDEKIFMYAEDVDLCFRMRKAGWLIRYMAGHGVFHYSGASSRRQRDRFFSVKKQREANTYFFLKHFGKARARRYLLAVFLGSIIRMAASAAYIPVLALAGKDREALFNPLHKYSSLFVWSVKHMKALR